MSDVNRVLISGRLTRDPELRKTPSGTSVLDLGLASNRYSKDKRQFTTFPRVTLWDKQAEWAAENLRTGDTVFVEGQLVDDNFKRDGQMTSGRLKIDNARVQLLRKKAVATNDETNTQEDEPVSEEVPTV